jgi:hypothetical protein
MLIEKYREMDFGRFNVMLIPLDFATAASQNNVFISREMCHIMIFFNNYSIIKEDRNRKRNIFVIFG